MSKFIERSKTYLGNELKDMFHDLYVTALDRAEKHLHPNKKSREWEAFRFDIMNAGNDYIRRVDNSLSEYYIEFRPMIFSVEYKGIDANKLSKTVVFDFGFKDNIPYFALWANNSEEANNNLLDFQELLDCGKISIVQEKNAIVYVVEGMYDIFHKVIPFFLTTGSLKGRPLERFAKWKEQVYEIEGQGIKNVR